MTRAGTGQYDLTFTGTYSAFTIPDDVAASISAGGASSFQAHDIGWGNGLGTLTTTTMAMRCFSWSTSSGSAVYVDGTTFTVIMLSKK